MNFHHNYTRNILIIFTALIYSCSNTDNDLKIDYPPGGYEFSKNITNKDFYCYPLIDKVSRRDSFIIAYHDAYFFHLFKEPNISLKPSRKAMFRLTYKGFDTSYVITLTEDEMIVKIGNGRYWRELDFSKLNEIENKHYQILRRDFPLDEPRSYTPPPPPPPPPDRLEEEIRYNKIYDSIKNNTSELLNPKYYDNLLKKAAVKDSFSFSIKKIKITQAEFIKFVNLLNQSGYWEVRYDPKCHKEYTEYYEYSLEANTGKKYCYIGNPGPCDSITNKFFQARRELFRLANVEKRWQQY